MSLTSIIFEVIDFRSFSNLWFWIGLAVMWSTVSHWVLGVPFDMVTRARRERYEGPAAEELVDVARVFVLRLVRVADTAALWLTGIAGFALTGLASLGFGFGIEFAQACLMMLGPLTAVLALSMRTARRILAEDPGVERLCQILTRHRLWIQLMGILSIFVTAMWGMYVNLSLPTWY